MHASQEANANVAVAEGGRAEIQAARPVVHKTLGGGVPTRPYGNRSDHSLNFRTSQRGVAFYLERKRLLARMTVWGLALGLEAAHDVRHQTMRLPVPQHGAGADPQCAPSCSCPWLTHLRRAMPKTPCHLQCAHISPTHRGRTFRIVAPRPIDLTGDILAMNNYDVGKQAPDSER